jgi:hypothetical protein
MNGTEIAELMSIHAEDLRYEDCYGKRFFHLQNQMARIVKLIIIAGLLFTAVLQFDWRFDRAEGVDDLRAGKAGVVGTVDQKDDDCARAAFLAAYKVFMHPRCMNCHPVGDRPLQGDDSHPHAFNVKRGPDGGGKSTLRCAVCHQETNQPGEHRPPGRPNWRLPPPTMRMVFEGRSPGDLCRQLKDPLQNGGKTLEQLIQHVSEDKLVLWGWDPGEGRVKPPLSHDEFARKAREWARAGAACP